ncbi:unnamed protein product [Ambrosiozyma monospora]|uniref:Unnamed protein product n=1 Tax=Ambrosiozyma monospora TaxID=43982 RepID=A0ACB5TBW3_AMBMO|nr:unnamed protein product [Ambrosiozyma monospora]
MTKVTNEMNDRFKLYQGISNGSVTSVEESKLATEVEELQRQIDEIQLEIDGKSKENDDLRSDYQARSSTAAELSSSLMTINKRHEILTTESKGLFKELRTKMVLDEIDEYEAKLSVVDQENQFLEKYIASLDTILKERMKLMNGHGENGRLRGSRSGTPH